MTAAHITELDFEVDRVEQWRPEVDLHRAVTLLEQGCPVDLALRILL
jgi:hypothetical protein